MPSHPSFSLFLLPSTAVQFGVNFISASAASSSPSSSSAGHEGSPKAPTRECAPEYGLHGVTDCEQTTKERVLPPACKQKTAAVPPLEVGRKKHAVFYFVQPAFVHPILGSL